MPKKTLISQPFLEQWVFISTLVFLAALTFSTALMEISVVSALVAWLLIKIKDRPALFPPPKIYLPLLGFVLLCVISFFWSDYPKQSFRGVLKVLKQVLLFWIVAETFSKPKRQRIAFQVVAASCLILGLDGMLQYVFGYDLIRQLPFEPASSGPRISASFTNYALLASYVITFLPMLFASGQEKEGKGEMFRRMLAITFGLLLLFWTRMRGAWAAFAVGLLFFLSFEKRKLYFILFVAALLGGLFFLPRSMIIHLDGYGKEQSLLERFDLWERAYDVIHAKPLTGTGINTYAVAHQKYDTIQSWRVRDYYAHNGYLQLAAETGLPSLILFLWFIYLYFQKGLDSASRLDGNSKRAIAGMLAGVLNFLILCMIDTELHNPQAVMGFWFLAGWATAYQRTAFGLKN